MPSRNGRNVQRLDDSGRIDVQNTICLKYSLLPPVMVLNVSLFTE